ncbi:NAD(P)-dependent oxidoreductase [Christiangramia sp. SM2212]|uniref:Saccharopine dehydrogenase [NAD(+), L-lysine-forming] n=1 Tax=Christiangramia sediminicola TaxID=3073267 RepID=A0ABU1ES80_9FLAO|nr:NAD(P)-dependent oxidoreductase [Christiangramia sp. SM2212]MDR5591008.1 NAD(P)-dependent oxidoreductase [Christiangramia sp. SM2212]
MIKFALIKERKTPPDRRVVFSPQMLKEVVLQFPEASFKVESSDIRIFSDQEYRDAGFEVSEDVSDCDVLLGVKEVPIPNLIPDKKYFFFSHTIKKQPYNRDLLREILERHIELYDHEVITGKNKARLIGFGRYAGLVGAYNGIRSIGIKEGKFELPKAEALPDLDAMLAQLDKITLPNYKFVLTGSGKVAHGAREILEHLKIKQIDPETYLVNEFNESVFCHIDVLDYAKRKDGAKGSRKEFYKVPENYNSDFMKFAKTSDVFIAGHFYGQGAPVFYSEEDIRDKDFRIKYVADISCDIAGPIASTIRPSTIAEPFYGYDPKTGTEIDFKDSKAITIMAVDNLPCELPKDASEGFGEMFLEHVIPAFFNNDKDGILARAKMTESGKLTVNYMYLEAFVKGEE